MTIRTRKPFVRRNWHMTSGYYDRLAPLRMIHADIDAWRTSDARLWFRVELRAGGKRLVAGAVYLATTGGLEPWAYLPEGAEPLQWSRANNVIFGPAHAGLVRAIYELAATRGQPVSIHCHYVPTPDRDAWPRGWTNDWTPRGPAPASARADTLPDLL